MFMIYLNTKFHRPRINCSLIINVKLQTEHTRTFRAAVTLLYYILKK
jgi:hypothetical protein